MNIIYSYTDRSRFLEALQNSDVTLRHSEKEFLNRNLDKISFTPAQGQIIDSMIKNHADKIGFVPVNPTKTA